MTNANNEIPVRRRDRGGVPWWAWVIAVVLLALLAWYLLSNMNKNNSGGATSSPAASPAGSTDLSSPSGGASPAGGSPDASGSPAASWIGTPNLTVVLPARAGL
jgi:hypothetical protein